MNVRNEVYVEVQRYVTFLDSEWKDKMFQAA